jgi:hypothetical protein
MQNLLAYWAGTTTVSVPYMLGPLMLLHAAPMLKSFTDGLSTSSTVRHVQTGLGVFALSMAALIAVRSLAQRRQRAQLTTPSSTTSSLVLESDGPTAISPLRSREQGAAAEDGSPFRRLLSRAQNAWENGSLWVAFMVGVACVPPIDGALFVLAIAVTSGAAIGTQFVAAFVYVFMTLVVVEVMLVSYLAAPAKTETVLRSLHNWAVAHRRQVLVAMFAVAGISTVAHSMGIF